jgi:hypothetical protein
LTRTAAEPDVLRTFGAAALVVHRAGGGCRAPEQRLARLAAARKGAGDGGLTPPQPSKPARQAGRHRKNPGGTGIFPAGMEFCGGK